MERLFSYEDIRRAWQVRDSRLAELIIELAEAPDPVPGEDGTPPLREGALTFAGFADEVRSATFRRKPWQEQAQERQQRIKALESDKAEVPLPDRAKLHEILLEMWQANGAFERDCLFRVIAQVPLRWGPWRALKRIFKEAETRGDWEMFGALAARFDTDFAQSRPRYEVSRLTLAYLVRRAWRRLRRQAETLPACYTDAAVDVLRFYTDEVRWTETWVANHIFFHETHKYSRRHFKIDRRNSNLLANRAYAELWRRTPRPLFALLERAQSEKVRLFATEALKNDFRTSLREVEPSWVARLISVKSETVDSFVIWLLANVPRFEQGAFRELGLHQPVLSLLDSPCDDARVYAAAYARTHARDLALEELIRLANNEHEEVRKLVRDLLQDRDPRKDVGLEAWGRLLGTEYGHELATGALRKHFGARELTPEWFKERLLSDDDEVFEFASELLPKVHSYKSLGPNYFRDLIDDERLTSEAAGFALDALTRFPAEEALGDEQGTEFLRRALLHPETTDKLQAWLKEERIAPKQLGSGYLKAIAFHLTWESDPWVAELKASGRKWAKDLAFNESLSKVALSLLSDVRKFSPSELGFDWLMQLAARSEPQYGEFATEYMVKAFVPADFAPKAEQPAAAAPSTPSQADLKGQSFLFTGKLATMSRGEATQKVTSANGKNASGVNAKLDYLVIGDDGSPLYGQGRKGSKQVAAEKLVAKGEPIKIISETAFLQMLAGEQRSFSQDSIAAGCERLWTMVTEPGAADAPLRTFALQYVRRHHPDINLELTDRPVDPGAEIPADFLSFDRVKPLFFDAREPLRTFALELARWELARWKPPIESIVEMCEAPHTDVRAFVSKALLADDSKEHQRYRIDPNTLTTDAVYAFCESLDVQTRALGMQLIARNPRLAVPEELFRLTESPDRQVRAMVVRTLWGLYRDKGVTEHWKPVAAVQSAVGKAPDSAKKPEPAEAQVVPAKRPEGRPASDAALLGFMRQMLFTIPPGRLPKASAEGLGVQPKKEGKKLRPLPARKAKLGLVEVMRDLALEDRAFAQLVQPLLQEFMASRGPAERAACLVALTRISKAHPSKDVA